MKSIISIFRPKPAAGECCSKCQSMTGTPNGLGTLSGHRGGYYHHGEDKLRRSVAQGCPLCKAIDDWRQRSLSDNEKIRAFPARFTEGLYWGGWSGRDERNPPIVPGHPLWDMKLEVIGFYIAQNGYISDNSNKGSFYFCAASHDDPASVFVPLRRESKELTTDIVKKIQHWLEECQSDAHPSCPPNSYPELPRRVLDLGEDNDSPIKIHENLGAEMGRYVALSYCWGPDASKWLMTRKATLDEHISLGLPSKLPKTLEDAVTVCRKLGIRFLWVDALCIIQDDPTDTFEQISAMGSIYKNSILTIAAAGSSAVSDGFLANRKPIKPLASLPFYTGAKSPPGTIFVRERQPINGTLEPWFSRGWTLQELILSPRVILFDSYQIAIKCQAINFRPVIPNWLKTEYGKFDVRNALFDVDNNTEKPSEGKLRQLQCNLWRGLVMEYSKRNLSYMKDRLPALAGIASELRNIWKDEYIAGFWKRTLIFDLLWYRPKDAVHTINSNSCSPTWSWSTVPFPVSFFDCVASYAKILDSEIQLVSTSTPFGQVQNGTICIEGPLLEKPLPYIHEYFWDFPETKPEPSNVSLLYICELEAEGKNSPLFYSDPAIRKGILNSYRHCFLTIEKSKEERYRRVGCAILVNSRDITKELEKLFLIPDKIIVIE